MNDKKCLIYARVSSKEQEDTGYSLDSQEKLLREYATKNYLEVKKGQKEKISQGGLPASPPLGYRTEGEKGHKIHVVDKEQAPLVKRMFELYSTGNYSLIALVKIMHNEGLRNKEGGKVGKSRMHKHLSNPFYYGKICWNNQIYNGQHEPIISKELFNAVQTRLIRSTDNPQYKKHLPVFKAKIRCEECGGVIAWETQKGHWYGHCNHYKKCSQKGYLRQENVEDQLFPYFDKVAPKNERIIQWLEEALKESHSDEIKFNTQKRESINRIIRTADKRIEEAYKDKLDGRMPITLCEKVMKDSAKEKEEAIESLSKLTESRTAYYEAGYAIHELALKSKEIYQSEKATPEEKRLLLSYVFSNLSQKADSIKPNYTLAFDFLVNWIPKVNSTFEPANYRLDKRKEDALASPNPVLLGDRDSNPNYLVQSQTSYH